MNNFDEQVLQHVQALKAIREKIAGAGRPSHDVTRRAI